MMPDTTETTTTATTTVLCKVEPIMYGGLMAFKKITGEIKAGTYPDGVPIVTPGFQITHVINLISTDGTKTGYYNISTKKIVGGLTGNFEMIALGVDN